MWQAASPASAHPGPKGFRRKLGQFGCTVIALDTRAGAETLAEAGHPRERFAKVCVEVLLDGRKFLDRATEKYSYKAIVGRECENDTAAAQIHLEVFDIHAAPIAEIPATKHARFRVCDGSHGAGKKRVAISAHGYARVFLAGERVRASMPRTPVIWSCSDR